MNFLGVTLLVAFAHLVSSEGTVDKTKDANVAVYDTVHRPYNYRPYGVDAYNNYDYNTYNTYDRNYDTQTFGAYPLTSGLGTQRLHLSGGIYRPYGYDDGTSYAYDTSAYHKPYVYDNTQRYYGASRYNRYQNAYNRGYY